MDNLLTNLIAAEGAKRERNWRVGRRWAAILAAIDFADRQRPLLRNTRERCLQLQREKLTANQTNHQ